MFRLIELVGLWAWTKGISILTPLLGVGDQGRVLIVTAAQSSGCNFDVSAFNPSLLLSLQFIPPHDTFEVDGGRFRLNLSAMLEYGPVIEMPELQIVCKAEQNCQVSMFRHSGGSFKAQARNFDNKAGLLSFNDREGTFSLVKSNRKIGYR